MRGIKLIIAQQHRSMSTPIFNKKFIYKSEQNKRKFKEQQKKDINNSYMYMYKHLPIQPHKYQKK